MAVVCSLLIGLLFCVELTSAKTFHYVINKQWNGMPTGHPDVSITLQENESENHLRFTVKAPFYTKGRVNATDINTPNLWHQEVAEVYFMNEKQEYLQLQLGPYSHYHVLLFAGERNHLDSGLELESRTVPVDDYWEGEAFIPGEYFPPMVTRFNAFVMNGEGENRRYWSLYPADNADKEPDFHQLKYFKPIDLESSFAHQTTYSEVWKKALGLVQMNGSSHIFQGNLAIFLTVFLWKIY